jgi:Domain of unknown function (DUF2020)
VWPIRRWPTAPGAAVLFAGCAVLAGCQSTGSNGAAAAPPPTTTATRTSKPPAPTRPTTTRRPSATPPPVPVEGRCPYASIEQVAETVGQHLSRATVTPTKPFPGCSFYRPNGEQAADIQVTTLATAVAAQARAIALGGRGANPVGKLGDGGVVAVTPTGALLAVSKGTALVVVRINQRISLEARELAGYVVARL